MKIIKEDIAHFVGGLLVILISNVFPIAAVLLTSLFVIYEMDESWSINDEAFRDIKIYLLGGFLGAIFLLAKTVIT